MSVKSITRAARLKNYLRMLMQQQSLILSIIDFIKEVNFCHLV